MRWSLTGMPWVRTFADREKGKAFAVDCQLREEASDDLARSRSHHGNRGPVVGDRGATNSQVGPLSLQPLLEPVEHRGLLRRSSW